MRDALTANSAHTGRPKAVLTAAAEMIGIDERRGREARAVKETNPEVFSQLKRGLITLNEAMEKIRPPADPRLELGRRAAEPPQPVSQERPSEAAEQPVTQADEPAGVPPLASKPAAPKLSRKERVEQAWEDVGRIFRFGQKSLDAFRASQRMSDSGALEFESLESDADKLWVRQAIQNNQSFSEAVKPLAGVDPKDPIQKLHTKTVRNDGFFAGQIGEFYHVVVLGDRAALLERMKGCGLPTETARVKRCTCSIRSICFSMACRSTGSSIT
jgi:hypothetical protein